MVNNSKRTIKLYETETGNKCPSNQIAYSEWMNDYIDWLENTLLKLLDKK